MRKHVSRTTRAEFEYDGRSNRRWRGRRTPTRGGIIGAPSPLSSGRSTADTGLPQDSAHRIVASFDGAPIHYDLYDAPSPSAVLVIPGFWRDRRHASMSRLARWVQEGGRRCAVIDLRGHGQSGGTFGFNLNEHHDVAAVCEDLLRSIPTLSSITLVGFSYGGAIAVSTAARHALPVSSLLLISPVADFSMISPRLNLFTFHRHIALSQALKRPRFAWNVRRAAKLRALDDIRDVRVPLCFVHVQEDWLIGHRHSEMLYEAACEPKELHVLDIAGNYHADRIFSVAPERIEPIVRGFLERHTPV